MNWRGWALKVIQDYLLLSAISTIASFISSLHRPLRLGFLPTFRVLPRRRFESMATDVAITIPDGYTLHTENTSHILLPSTNEAFLNPIQEFNRDISVACITTWSEELDKEKEAKWNSRQSRKAAGCSDKKRLKRECSWHCTLTDLTTPPSSSECRRLLNVWFCGGTERRE
jgi:hypothetical protein